MSAEILKKDKFCPCDIYGSLLNCIIVCYFFKYTNRFHNSRNIFVLVFQVIKNFDFVTLYYFVFVKQRSLFQNNKAF